MNLELVIRKEGKEFKIETDSPLGKRSGFFEIDPSLHSKVYDIQEAIEKQRPLDEGFVEKFGIQLFELLFSDTTDLFHKCMDESDHVEVILNMKDPLLNVLPWELCYDKEYDIFLGADSRCSLVRRDQKSTQAFEKIDYPLTVLVIISSPMDLDEKGEYQPDPDEIVELMEPLKDLEDKGLVRIDFLERASVARIQDALKKGYHIVHFVGHGYYDAETEKGYLIIEDKDRNSKELSGSEVARLFGETPPQLLILTACESSPLIPFLLTRRIPAVMAMQYTVLKDVAHEFVERFYSLLLKGDPVLKAVSSARNAVLLEEGKECTGWFTPVLFLRSDTVLKINIGSLLKKPEKEPVKGFDMIGDLTGVETFVGRRKDLWLVEKALLEDRLKLAVVTGIGGIGKTALASKFARKYKAFSAVFAKKVVDSSMRAEELLGLLDQFFILNSDASLHHVIEEPDLDLKLDVLNHCLKKGYLIILDNFEVLIKDSRISEDMEKFLKSILSGDHSSKVLITSRYGFTFRDEKASGLVRTVDLKELSLQYAVQLLGKLGIEDIDVRRRIYNKIGGNPQFLEFFVRLARTRPVKELLKDVTPVREKIGEWLLEELVALLSEEEKKVLEKVSVFRFKFEKDAFGAKGEVVDRLVYYSLVKFESKNGDYFMHPGVREYVYGLMSSNKRVGAHAEAAKYYDMLLEKKKADLLDILELHYHLAESKQYEIAGEWVLELSEPFLRWGYWRKLMELLMYTVKTTKDQVKARSLHNLAVVLQSFGNYKEAEKYYKESLDLAENLGDKQGIAQSLHQLGNLEYLQGNYKEAEKYYKESLDLAESLGDKKGIAGSLHQLGMLQQDQGNYKEAEKYYKESLDLAENLGDKAEIARILHQLGNLEYLQGNYKEAEKYYKESLDLAESLGDKQGIAKSLGQLGMLREKRKIYEEAEEYYIISLSILSELGSPDAETVIKSLQRVREIIGEKQFDHYWKAITNQEVPDFIKIHKELEDLIQYILHIVENNNQKEIEQATETIKELLKESEPGGKQFLQVLLELLSGKDISKKVQELEEPFKSALRKYIE